MNNTTFAGIFLVICLVALAGIVAQYVGGITYFTYEMRADWAFALYQINPVIMTVIAVVFGFLAFATLFVNAQGRTEG